MYRIIANELLRRRIPTFLSWDVQTPKAAALYSMRYTGTGIIDWGDTQMEVLSAGMLTKTHTYAVAGTYTIKITGSITLIRAGTDASSINMVRTIHSMNLYGYRGNDTSYTNGEFNGCQYATIATGCSFASTVTNLIGTFMFCYGLTSLPSGLIPSGVTNLLRTFYNCSGLTSLPSGLIPSGYTGSLSNTFRGCAGLTSLPSGLIPSGVTDLLSTFDGCVALLEIPGSIWPDSWTKTNINIGYMFNRSSPVSGKPTGTLPADKLWNAPAGTFSNATNAFSNCTSLDNYSSIPSTWGGPA